VDGFFPYAAQDLKEFIYSNFIYEAAWVLIERKKDPIDLAKTSELSKWTMGNVTGVELRPGIQELVDQKKLKVENTTNDTNNLLMLATKRVDFISMDAVVYRYRMLVDKELRPYRGNLQINIKPIASVKYGLALKNTLANKNLLKSFRRATSVSSTNQLIDFYFQNLLTTKDKSFRRAP
jgi:ABC-type amino acid transport substrate-binding protein